MQIYWYCEPSWKHFVGEAGLNEDSRLQQAAADNHIAGDARWINLNDLIGLFQQEVNFS